MVDSKESCCRQQRERFCLPRLDSAAPWTKKGRHRQDCERLLFLPGQDVRFNWRKKTITGSDMLIFPRNGELESISQPDFHVFIMSLPECLLQEAIEAADSCEVSELLEAETVSCSPTKMASLREKLRGLALSAREDDSFLGRCEGSA